MMPTYTVTNGCRYTYYVCPGAQPKSGSACQQKRVAAVDLEPSLFRQLEPIVGTQPSTAVVQHWLERVTYDSRNRQVRVFLHDGAQLDYEIAAPNRRGVRQAIEPDKAHGRVPRVSRLMALAIQFETLVRDGVARDYAELAQLGHISRARMSQIMALLHLAPAIQEALLFLPNSLRGPERVTEKSLRTIAELVDWERQLTLFRTVAVGRQP
jgi:hypothetical protein